MAEQDDREPPAPETLKLFRKKYASRVIPLAILAVIGAIAFAAYKIYVATLPPELH